MLILESTIRAADNAGGVFFKCITVYGGFKRRYARLGEIVGSIAKTRRVYSDDLNKKTLAKKVKKKENRSQKKLNLTLDLI